MATPPADSRYPLTYFFCGALVNPATLQQVLGLPTAPKLRKAKIIGYQRSTCGTESAVLFDDLNFGGWGREERVKGVAYKVANEQEERRLHEYVGDGCSVQVVEIEVKGRWLGRTDVYGMAFFTELEEFGGGGERCLTVKGMMKKEAMEAQRARDNTLVRTEEGEGEMAFRSSIRMTPRTRGQALRTGGSNVAIRQVRSYNRNSRTESEPPEDMAALDEPVAPTSEQDRDGSDTSSLGEVMQALLAKDEQSRNESPKKHRKPWKLKSTVLPNGDPVLDFVFPAKLKAAS